MKAIEKALDLLEEIIYDDTCAYSDAQYLLLRESRSELAELKKNLKNIAWVENERGDKSYEFCPACNATERHGSDCWLAKLIK